MISSGKKIHENISFLREKHQKMKQFHQKIKRII